MKSIDAILLIGIITIAFWMIFAPKRIDRILNLLVALVILLAVLQFVIQGLYWHFVPGYLLILSAAIVALFPTIKVGTKARIFFSFFFVFMILASIIPWLIFLPIPELPEPNGDYKVGTNIFRWIDQDRAEETTSDPDDKRNVVVQAWYPTVQDAKGGHADYMDGIDALPEKIGVIPGWIFNNYDQVDTYGILDAPICKARKQWPVILFMAGNGASRAFYTSLVTGLASHGYVVLSVDHPYEAMITQLANGKLVTTIENHLPDDPDLIKFMDIRLQTRIADVRFVLNQLGNKQESANELLLSLDRSRIVIAGHSLGGAAAAATMATDSSIKAAVNIDGTLYGELPAPNGTRPFMLIESKKDKRGTFMRYETANQKLFRQFGGGYRFEIPGADHYSFTDAPLLLASPARFFASRFFAFGQVPIETQHATVAIMHAFFDGILNSKGFDPDSVAHHFPGVVRKPVDATDKNIDN